MISIFLKQNKTRVKKEKKRNQNKSVKSLLAICLRVEK